jgi:hypothetical protein
MQLHPEFSYRVDYIGNERQPVLVIDNFLADPLALIEFCARNAKFNNADAFYPGVRAPTPDIYLQAIYHYLRDIIYAVFVINDSMIGQVQADYSMVLTSPDQLKLVQCLPHYDSLISTELAAVHYLCGSEKGGTSLYRHRETGFEYINKARVAIYTEKLTSEIDNIFYPKCYMNGSNQLFEQIASYEAIFNRMIIYRCTSLHSGNIAPDFSIDPNPRTGRLTINTFIGG